MLYFIEGAELIKIGYTQNHPSVRFKALAAGSPVPLRVLGITPGNLSDEKALHDRFASSRSHGEWFRKSAALTRYIQAHSAPYVEEDLALVAMVRRYRHVLAAMSRSPLPLHDIPASHQALVRMREKGLVDSRSMGDLGMWWHKTVLGFKLEVQVSNETEASV